MTVAAVFIVLLRRGSFKNMIANTVQTVAYKNGVIFVPSFVFIGLFLRPRCFRKEA